MVKSKTSWLNYMNGLREQPYGPELLNNEILDGIFSINSLTQTLFNHTIPWIYLLDYTSGKYLMVSDSIKFSIGYEPDYFKKGGIAACLDKYDVNHMRLFNEEIFPDRLQLLKKIPISEHPNYIFSYNFKFKNCKGEVINLLQRNCFVKSDEDGNPLLSFGTITNINHYKSENPVIQVVEKINSKELLGGTNVTLKKVYYFNGEDRLFTKREKELLLWLADGFSSKQIADKLFISEHTVINHKRSMMRKCDVNNSAELVSFAIRNQLY